MRIFTILLCLLLISTEISAQTRYYHNIVWGRVALTDTINKNLRYELLLQHRRQNIDENDLNALAANQFTSYWPWLHYTLSPTTRVSFSPLGYFESWVLIVQPSDQNKEPVREWRVSARIDQETKVKHFRIFNRYGLEYRQRDLSNNGIFQPNWRIRYMLRLEKSIKLGILKNPLVVVINDEIFLQFGKAVRGNPNVFDQNRIYTGFNYAFTPYLKGSLGYVWGIQTRISGRETDYYNYLWAVLTIDNIRNIFKRKSVRLKHAD